MVARFLILPTLALSLTGGLVMGQVLTHGPVTGGVTDSTANVFVRTDQSANVALWYGTDPNLVTYLVSDTLQTDVTSDFTRIIPLTGLSAETTYYLNILVNGIPQSSFPYPTFTTFAPVGHSRSFSFVVLTDFVSTFRVRSPVSTYASASAINPAFVFIGGDFDHRDPHKINGKRGMFKDLYDPNTPFMGDFVNLILRKYPIIHQWDDHDSGLNNVDKTYADWNLTQQAYQEYVPTYPVPAIIPGIWQKFSYAQVDCFMLDCRSQRDPDTDQDDSKKSMLDGNNLGATGQLQWLENGLLTSTATWKVIFSSVVTNPTTKFPDGWAGYQTEWNALRSYINSNNILGVVFISGDLHLGAIDDGTTAGFAEMSVLQPNGLGGCPSAGPGQWSEGYYGECAGFGLVSVLQNPDRLILQVMDQEGTVQISHTMTAGTPPPTPTPTPSPTPTPTPGSPVITKQPMNTTVRTGQIANFRVVATGDPKLEYQWMKNGNTIVGATRDDYRTPPATLPDSGSLFAVTVSNSEGSVTSNGATLTVRPTPTPTPTPAPSP